MTANKFCKLLYPDALDVLYSEGVYIGKRRIHGSPAILFQLNDFYVEIVYIAYRGSIASVFVTGNMAVLNPYLPQIDITDIILVLK